jgi:low affinity Fe/Cu permease
LIAPWTAFLKSLDQQLLLTEQLISNNTDTDQLAANYDEKLKQMEKAQGKKKIEMGQNSEKELDRMSKQIQSGDEQNLN